MSTLAPPTLSHVCDLAVELAPVFEMGQGRAGQRRIIQIIGGTARGPRLNGRILNLGADWQTVFASGMAELDARYAVETEDGAIVEIRNYGYRDAAPDVLARLAAREAVDPTEYYMRTQARLESGDPRYDWVNRTLFVGTGARLASAVQISLYAIN